MPSAFNSLRQLLALTAVICSFLASANAGGVNIKWIDPTATELAMKSEPKAPGAGAVILSYDEFDDSNSAEVVVHMRVKVLTEGGLSAGTVNVPDRVVENDEFNQLFFARTIHPDGSIVEFKATPENLKTVNEDEGSRKVIAMPAVTVGSILEYGYHFSSQNTLYTYLIGYYAPIWRVQQPYFVKDAHFLLKGPESNYDPEYVRWVANLPVGVAVSRVKQNLEVRVQDLPAYAVEQYMPPPSTAFYNVRFFYHSGKQEEYWGRTGASVDDSWSDFDSPTRTLKAAIRDLVLPTDNDETKLRKLYLAVEAMENVEFSRKHSWREDKADGLSMKQNADGVWLRKRGSQESLTLLFVALARAAGYQAYPMAVASRNHAVFDQRVLSWSQMDDMVAIVNVAGREVFFDPGTRLCPFAHVAPWHSNVIGVSTEKKLVKIRTTPEETYKDFRIDRAADLTVTADGSVSGTIQVVWSGGAGLTMRQDALRDDAHQVETAAEKRLQEQLPDGVEVKLTKLTGLADGEASLVATFSASGHLGLATGKRMILPAQFFVSTAKPQLAPETRTQPVLFPEPYVERDRVVVHLPDGYSIEALPQPHVAAIAKDMGYSATVNAGNPDQHVIQSVRAFVLNRIDYKQQEYEQLHKYFAGIANADGEQIVLKAETANKQAGN